MLTWLLASLSSAIGYSAASSSKETMCRALTQDELVLPARFSFTIGTSLAATWLISSSSFAPPNSISISLLVDGADDRHAAIATRRGDRLHGPRKPRQRASIFAQGAD